MKLVVIDLETSGLNISTNNNSMGSDCILEVGIVILNAGTLVEEFRNEWLVFPPLVQDLVSFERWHSELREKNKFVFDLHSKTTGDKPSLLSALRAAAQQMSVPLQQRDGHLLRNGLSGLINNPYSNNCVADDIALQLTNYSNKTEGGSQIHPGNSDMLFTGNSIANLDIPMLRLWMPKVHQLLSYRILDVSVLRTFYQDIAKVKLPEQLAADIKSGGGGHRALSDAVFCAQSLRELVKFSREADLMKALGASYGVSAKAEL